MLAGLLAVAQDARAEIYRFVAPDGTVHFSNVPVDKRYKPFAASGRTFSSLRSASPDQRRNLYRLIDDTARQFDVEAALVRAVVRAESNYDPRAVSPAGALGLMQLMPGTARDLAVANPLDPEENVRGGVRYLRYLIDRFQGDTTLAVAAYHAGERNVDRHGGIPPIKATRSYVKRVLTFQKHYRERLPRSERAIYTVKADDSVLYTTTPPSTR